jgi:hypothetical protein
MQQQGKSKNSDCPPLISFIVTIVRCGTKWLMVMSRAELEPIKSPADQIAAFAAQGDIKLAVRRGKAHSSQTFVDVLPFKTL